MTTPKLSRRDWTLVRRAIDELIDVYKEYIDGGYLEGKKESDSQTDDRIFCADLLKLRRKL